MSGFSFEIQQGINALKECLGAAGCDLLSEDKLRAEEVASFNWPLPDDYLGVSRILRVSFNKYFPGFGLDLQVTPSPWLQWPHATKNSLCLYGAGQQAAIGSPEKVVKDTFERLAELINLILPNSDSGIREAHFSREISSYWDQQLHWTKLQLILLDQPHSACPLFVLTDMRNRPGNIGNYIWLAANGRKLSNHLSRLSGLRERIPAAAAAAFFVPLQSLPSVVIPEATDVLNWISPHISDNDFENLSKWKQESSHYPLRWLLLSIPNTSPPLIRAFVLRQRGMKKEGYCIYGKRAARRKMTSKDICPPAKLQAAPIHLLARSTIHSRDLSTGVSGLFDKKIIMVGAGTLGGAVASQLVRSGVGKLIIIDPDRMADANIGRHVLGADDLGRYKVHALAERLRRDVPLTEIVSIAEYLQFAVLKNSTILKDIDAIVVTTADWATEELIWSWKSQGKEWGVIQGWSEPGAIAGHALVAPPGGVFDGRSLFDENGNFHHRFSNWPNHGVIPLPGCGAGFIAGGSLSINNIANMVSRSVINLLTDPPVESQWFSYINGYKNIEVAGGVYVGPQLPEDVQEMLLTNSWPLEKL